MLPARTHRDKEVVPDERFELPTFGLQNRCTTTVLIRRVGWMPLKAARIF